MHARFQSKLDEQQKDGTTRRAHLERQAQSVYDTRGRQAAREFLASEPEYPEELEYLLNWSKTLHGRSGAHMSGFNPISPSVIEAWCNLMEITLHPLEFEALLLLDASLFGNIEEEKEEATQVPRQHTPWPEKK